jgi:hypothetical protein
MVALALFSLLSVLSTPVLGHLYLTEPKPNNFDAASGTYKNPLDASGADFPCKGFVDGPASANWAAGSQQKTVVHGSAVHGGGSCQVSLSYDKGATFKVMKTWLGECPIAAEGNLPAEQDMGLEFTVPADAPAGEALFAWTWFNQVGNREMYMNCATVTITGGSGGAGLSALPDMFVANVGNGCATAEGSPVDIPNPGADVQRAGKAPVPPTGSCPAGGAPAQGQTPAAPGAAPSAPGVPVDAPSGAAPEAAAAEEMPASCKRWQKRRLSFSREA